VLPTRQATVNTDKTARLFTFAYNHICRYTGKVQTQSSARDPTLTRAEAVEPVFRIPVVPSG
jgi:hypothetical protein